DLAISAGQDFRAEAAHVEAQQHLTLAGERDVNLKAGTRKGAARDQSRVTSKGLLSSKTTDAVKSMAWERAQGTTVAGKTVTVAAKRNLNIEGSNVVGDGDVTVSAGGNLRVAGAVERHAVHQHLKTRKKGIGSGGGFSVGHQKQTRSDTLSGASTGLAAST